MHPYCPSGACPRLKHGGGFFRALPAPERAFLAAPDEVSARFRGFDLSARPRSEEAQAPGETGGNIRRLCAGRGG
ncbi:hypothetical protein [Roseovarius sp.]|uniref:hypothetical protein n=1 Tax=Roseovarius sp. TaxID=1486281 RepID=UPI00356155DD